VGINRSEEPETEFLWTRRPSNKKREAQADPGLGPYHRWWTEGSPPTVDGRQRSPSPGTWQNCESLHQFAHGSALQTIRRYCQIVVHAHMQARGKNERG